MTDLEEVDLQPFTQVHLDPDATLQAALASQAAYVDLDDHRGGREPWPLVPGYDLVGRFTGWDELVRTHGVDVGIEERFGLVYRRTAAPTELLIAFRGTDSLWDDVDDLKVETTPFQPFAAPAFPTDVAVETGFFGIYHGKGGLMTASMQQQLFGVLRALAPSRLRITGHSLGAALASLFALDVAASLPKLPVECTTFASPRVGTARWKSVYEGHAALLASSFRVANWWDWVPSLPPGYDHVGQPFFVRFKVQGDGLHLLDRHSLANYTAVLRLALPLDPQVYVGPFPDAAHAGWTMDSSAPPSATAPEWAALSRAVEQQALRDATCRT